MDASARFTHDDCIQTSERVAWKIGDIIGDGKFDFTRAFLPEALAQVRGISCLNADEKLKLNQLRGLTYAHLFAFVEEFIIRKLHEQAGTYGPEDGGARRALLRFTEEEVKHQMLFESAKKHLLARMGAECKLVPGAVDVAGFVLSKSSLGVMLLTTMLEWTTQHHYTDMFRSVEEKESLDPTFVRMFKAHWVEEAQHTKVDHLEIDRLKRDAAPDACDRAVDEVLEIGGAFDGLLKAQAELDVGSLERLCGRTFSAADQAEIVGKQHAAYRYTFLISGLQHPQVIETFGAVSASAPGKLAAVAKALAGA